MKSFLLSILAFLGLYTPVSPSAIIITPSPAVVVSTLPSIVPIEKSDFILPTPDFFARITKKPFGLHVSPSSSPVKPEKFSGFHTGVDVEYEDVLTEVPVQAIYSGKIIYSGFVRGYGGVVAQSINHQDTDYIVIYGHLSPTSLVTVGSTITAGQTLGVLGKGNSSETDGERRHLHLSIIKGSSLSLKGYVPSESLLTLWVDPVDLLKPR